MTDAKRNEGARKDLRDDGEADGLGDVLVGDEEGDLADGPQEAGDEGGQGDLRVDPRPVLLVDAVDEEVERTRQERAAEVREHVHES